MRETAYRISALYKRTRINDEYTLLAREKGGVLIQSKLGTNLLEAIDELKMSKGEILTKFAQFGRLPEVIGALRQLEEEGYTTDTPQEFPAGQYAYWESLGFDPTELLKILKNYPVQLSVLDLPEQTLFSKTCVDSGLQFSKEGSWDIVLTNSYLHPDLTKINEKAILQNRPWLLVRMSGHSPLVGPFFLPADNDSACWKCMEHRLLLHDHENALFQELKKTEKVLPRPFVYHPLAVQAATHTVIHEAISWLYKGESKSLKNQLIQLNPANGEREIHRLVKRPQCSVCGDPERFMTPPRPIELKQENILETHLGAYRTVTPEETLRRNEHHVSPLIGIVPFLEPYMAFEDAPIYNYGSGKNLALQSKSMFWLNYHARTGNGGKGKLPIQAKTGALCESIERFCGIYRGKTYSISDTFQQLESAIHPNDCFLFSESQLANREKMNQDGSRFYNLIPVPFDVSLEVEWTPIFSLSHNDFKFLPTFALYAQYPAPDETSLYAYPDSNGCAAGNTIEEAILQGFLELVERDAAAIWWYNEIPRPAVDLRSAENPYIDKMIEYYGQIDRELYVLDLTNDLGIPVFVSISYCKKTERKDRALFAFGAHIDASIALERAIIEMNQLLPVVQFSENYLTKDPDFIHWLDNVNIKDHAYLNKNSEPAKDVFKDYPAPCPPTLYDSIQYCLKRIEDLGMEILVHDLSQPDIELKVVRVVVPGLRHFWRRTGQGRLYDVPVRMGWLTETKTEKQLNPMSIFI